MDTISRDTTILVAGAGGMVGSALVRRLQGGGYTKLLTPRRQELDLMDQAAVYRYLAQHRPGYIFIAAAKVGGIQANNTYRAEFLFQNLSIQNNLIHGAHLAGVQRLMFLGSSCIYPKLAPQPIREDSLLTGLLEPTNEPYAIAKIAGIKMCEAYNAQYGRRYVSVMPTNLYGPNDNYDLASSHVLPALIRKAHEAKLRGDSEYVVWGSGTPRREFLYVDDLADACLHLVEQGFEGPLINVGAGSDLSIQQLAAAVMAVVGFAGRIVYDRDKPDGTPRKLMDSSRLYSTGWKPRVALEEGLRRAYQDFLRRQNIAQKAEIDKNA
jgi:GDP-L-fucose synthase